MRQFKELGISTTVQSFVGDKIKMERILNRSVTVLAYRIEDSKFQGKGNGKCLYMQIEINDVKYVVFTGSTVLMETIKKIPADSIPFSTTIVKMNDHYEFT